jgi:hypothetical protein
MKIANVEENKDRNWYSHTQLRDLIGIVGIN